MDPSGLSSEAEPSAIDELQSALGSILIAEEDRSTKPWTSSPACVPFPDGKGTVPAIFACPREVRDRIYYYYLYRENQAYYSRGASARWPFLASEDVVSLFQTCQKVYREAVEVFHRYNQVEIGSEPRLEAGPVKVLDRFPAAHAQALQMCCRQYGEYGALYVRHGPLKHHAGELWHMVIRDAYLFKSRFPKLRRFTAILNVRPRYFEEQEGMVLDGKTEEEKVRIWMEWVRFSTGKMRALPPLWMKIRLALGPLQGDRQPHQDSLNEAQVRFAEELAAEEGVDDLDALGGTWAEETGSERAKLAEKRRTDKGMGSDVGQPGRMGASSAGHV
ncbi:hypothetical protein CGRA01v4_11056 [Colletotrichum graminicola]|uniref:Uncharacterized protein n=1 Tax=Colletotrichum graminicola (strain M1.001 / M2 / FGSC 10212) TaxID=645133 RepID=E3QKS7_COLGM|nr:uncharacterized protein GLRG_06609 [Colletotrichum graminicola M1.001]EFQ31465.1 hypothetical protein GLRG_06609 [Colletotrichum graminicola M1.001]WDK19769.1 hypothetical protein CGRA01v4_11056 [Colletotrichum graminicola]